MSDKTSIFYVAPGAELRGDGKRYKGGDRVELSHDEGMRRVANGFLLTEAQHKARADAAAAQAEADAANAKAVDALAAAKAAQAEAEAENAALKAELAALKQAAEKAAAETEKAKK